MKKYFAALLTITLVIAIAYNGMYKQVGYAEKTSLSEVLTEEEVKYLETNRERLFKLGLDPYEGLEYFIDGSIERGYIFDLVKRLESDIGIDIEVVRDKPWGEVIDGIKYGGIDIVLGANESEDRKKFMAFTKPYYSYNYVIISRKDSSMSSIGDIDGKKIGFLEGDIAVDMFPTTYKNLSYKQYLFDSQKEGIKELSEGSIEGFITSGGETVYSYIFKYDNLKVVTPIHTIYSDMSLSTNISDNMLASILQKELDILSKDYIPKIMMRAKSDYIRKIVNLSDQERGFLNSNEVIKIGSVNNYYPYEYFSNGSFKGITGRIITDIVQKLGLNVEYINGDFDTLYNMLLSGEIDILNVAKTDERMSLINYSDPYILERDAIFGKVGSEDVIDIYGLDGKRVVVVKGYYQRDLLLKNLSNPVIIETESTERCIEMIASGSADYMIENPQVVRFYSEELGVNTLAQKGNTSTDTFFYFGINKEKPELRSLINKIIPIVDIENLKKLGYEDMPVKSKIEKNASFIFIIVILMITLIFMIVIIVKVSQNYIAEKTEKELLLQKEQFLYTDSLTDLKSRNYFKDKVLPYLNYRTFPQAVIVCDVNNLKTLNDVYGHLKGDELLIRYANILRNGVANFNEEDYELIRMGGDEFLIILYDTNESYSKETVRKIINSSKVERILTSDGKEHEIWAGYGISIRNFEEESFDEAFRIADQKMYLNKNEQKLKKNLD